MAVIYEAGRTTSGWLMLKWHPCTDATKPGRSGLNVPLYEYRCGDCQRITSALVYSWTENQQPDCEHCGGGNLQRLISRFSFRPSWGGSLNWAPSRETTSDVDENSPASIDSYMGKIKKEMGGQTSPEFDRERREIKDS